MKQLDLIFDMGGSRTRFALVEDGEMGEIARMDTDRGAAGADKFLEALEAFTAGKTVRSIVGCMPGEREGDDGKLVLTPNLPGWSGQPIGRLMRDRFIGADVTLFNDAVLGGLGEAHFGAGETSGVMAYFTVSTGVNGVRIVDGSVDPTIGRYELGFQLITDASGKLRSLESRVGGAALQMEKGVSPREVHDHQVWRDRARNLAIGLYNTCLYWDPKVIVFGGSMMRDIDLADVRRELERLPRMQVEWPRMELAKLGDTAGLNGALAWVRMHKH